MTNCTRVGSLNERRLYSKNVYCIMCVCVCVCVCEGAIIRRQIKVKLEELTMELADEIG